jgi:hypothetical protein
MATHHIAANDLELCVLDRLAEPDGTPVPEAASGIMWHRLPGGSSGDVPISKLIGLNDTISW